MASNSNSYTQLSSTYPKMFQQMKLRQKEYVTLIKDLHEENKALRNSLNDQSRNSTTTNWRSMHNSNQLNSENNQTPSHLKVVQYQVSNRILNNSQNKTITQGQNYKMFVPDAIKQENNKKKQFIILGNHQRQNSPKKYAQLQKTIGNSLYNKICKQVPLVRQMQKQQTKRVMAQSSSQRILYNTAHNSPRVMITPLVSPRASPMGSPRGSPMGSPMGSPRVIPSPRNIAVPKMVSQNHSVQHISQNVHTKAFQYPPKIPLSKPVLNSTQGIVKPINNNEPIIKPTNSQLFAYLQQQMKNTKTAAMCLEKHLSTLVKKQDHTKQVSYQNSNTDKGSINYTQIQSLTKFSQKNIENLPILSEKTINQNIRIKDDNSQVRIVSDKQFLQIQENIQESQVYNIEPKIIQTQNQEEKQNHKRQTSNLSKKVTSNNKNKSAHAVQHQNKLAFQGDRRITFQDLEAGKQNQILMDINFGNLADQDMEYQKLTSNPMYRIQYGNGYGKQAECKSPGHSPKGSLCGSGRKKKAQRINNQIYL